MSANSEHIHFVTGRLAEHAVRRTAEQVAEQVGFQYSVSVLPITVAALMTPKWILRHLEIPSAATRVIVPGYLANDIDQLREKIRVQVDSGPRDIRDLPLFFGKKRERDATYGQQSIDIIAEINHAPRQSLGELVRTAQALQKDGADIIDLGCDPGHRWIEVADAVRAICDLGARVSIDSFDPWEVARACAAGAELVLSVNSSNRAAAVDWGTEVVVIPDVPGDEKSFENSIDFLAQARIPMRLDPILEPLGCGFANSLKRYHDCRARYPDAAMMMGIGNITELTDCDSAGINVLLLGVCVELGIESVLTTQVINWARTSVRECDLARRLVHYACSNSIPPKHLEPALVMLRDERVADFDADSIAALAAAVRDQNVRIFVSGGEIHAASVGVHVHSSDPFDVMQQLQDSTIGESINASHGFYLGFEMAKALTAITLSKQYEQDEALNWGYLTRAEDHHRLARKNRAPNSDKQH